MHHPSQHNAILFQEYIIKALKASFHFPFTPLQQVLQTIDILNITYIIT